MSELEAKAPEIQKMKEDYAEVLKVCIFPVEMVYRYPLKNMLDTRETGHSLVGEV